jgi:hypothetical protein
MEMHVCLNVFHDRAEPPAVGAQITKEAFGTAPNSPRIAPRFLFLGLVGFGLTSNTHPLIPLNHICARLCARKRRARATVRRNVDFLPRFN